MNEIRTLIVTEARLLFRDPISWLVGDHPSVGDPHDLRRPFRAASDPIPRSAACDGSTSFAPSLVVITTATLAIQTLPIRLATYREKGILRRLSTTPARPSGLLVAQLVIYSVTAILGLVLLVDRRKCRLRHSPVRQNPIGYVAAFGLGMAGLLAIGLLLAAVAPSAGVATAIAVPLFFVVMFLGGVYLPRMFLPDVLVAIGEFTPPGVQGLQDAWLGAAPQLLPLAVLAGVTVIAGVAASRAFRWE